MFMWCLLTLAVVKAEKCNTNVEILSNNWSGDIFSPGITLTPYVGITHLSWITLADLNGSLSGKMLPRPVL